MTRSNSSDRVAGIHRIALQMPDMAEAVRFYRDTWKLRPAGKDGEYHAFRTADCAHDDFLLKQGPSRIAHLAFAVASMEALDGFAARLAAAGFRVSVPGDALPRSDAAAIAVTDPDGREVRLVVPAGDTAPASGDIDPLGPLAIGHVVLWTPDQPAAEQFYGLLGFQVTDRTHAGMSFLRCNADHHTLALMKSKTGRTGVQHIAFDVGSLDNVMRNFGRLRDQGLDCAWGVGRHGPGNNIFSYYADPAGNFVEYYGDMEVFPVDDLVEARIWGPEHKGDIWGVAGIPPLAFRE
ncbi:MULTISPECIES: VOC family protein [Sphingomonadales]|uniref:VOC family protein n=1 Tax=Novosphingobium album (ex Liu et al. 2023) TaxID=3031130 RepID=A0ABT5WPN6_9SPHN|nr:MULTISPECIES: VOC family protein [Sphingomonadales]MBB3992288.1 catechol 2,3-dioxygenase-like lactoylglutathione lyase family enzyme [Croceicoccus naphthovorans]MDE8651839.1 VOC family protein [Novosphingobium album (ex Liu et al. 2023)]